VGVQIRKASKVEADYTINNLELIQKKTTGLEFQSARHSKRAARDSAIQGPSVGARKSGMTLFLTSFSMYFAMPVAIRCVMSAMTSWYLDQEDHVSATLLRTRLFQARRERLI
jgi:hypothetical protein